MMVVVKRENEMAKLEQCSIDADFFKAYNNDYGLLFRATLKSHYYFDCNIPNINLRYKVESSAKM